MMDSRKLPMGRIGFEGLQVACIIGVLPNERVTLQDLIIDLKVSFNASREAFEEDFEPGIDYTVLADMASHEAKSGGYRLIETLASRLLDLVFAKYGVAWAWIRLRKPAAIPGSAGAILELERNFSPEVL